jgi:hypothetical protein
MAPDDVVSLAAQLTQAAIEHTSAFTISNESYRSSSVDFMEAMYNKLVQLTELRGQVKR